MQPELSYEYVMVWVPILERPGKNMSCSTPAPEYTPPSGSAINEILFAVSQMTSVGS